MPTVRYSVGIIEWTKEEAKEIDRKARKVVIMYDGIQLRSNVEERLHLPRTEGGRRLVSIKYYVNDEMENLALYTLRNNEKLVIIAAT